MTKPTIKSLQDELAEARATSEARSNIINDARMLALLQELIDIEGPQPGHVGWYLNVQAVIAKATGAA